MESSYLGDDGEVVMVVERDDESEVAEAKTLAWQQQQREAAAQESVATEATEEQAAVSAGPLAYESTDPAEDPGNARESVEEVAEGPTEDEPGTAEESEIDIPLQPPR